MMFKAWLRGIHHSVLHLQPYIDGYTYRFYRHKMKEGNFEYPIQRMVENAPYPYKSSIYQTSSSKKYQRDWKGELLSFLTR